jgi:hypothetical protein
MRCGRHAQMFEPHCTVRRWLKPPALRRYCSDLCNWGAGYLSQRWGTPLAMSPELSDSTCMISAQLPVATSLVMRHRQHVERLPEGGGGQGEGVWGAKELLGWAKGRLHGELCVRTLSKVPRGLARS